MSSQSRERGGKPVAAAGGADGGGAVRRMDFHGLGTRCFVHYEIERDDGAAGRAEAFEQAVHRWMQRFEARYSRFREDSIISRINRAAGGDWVSIDEETGRYLDMCQQVHFMTRGIIDPTAGCLMRLWDYQSANPRVPSDPEIAAALGRVGWSKVERRPGAVRLPRAGMSLDLGGWGKEFAVDMVGRIAAEHGLRRVMVDFGHDIHTIGVPSDRPAWHIGLEDPMAPGTLWGSIAVAGQSVASSGDYLRGFTHGGRRYGHIVDPRNGRPVDNGCRQVTVIAGSCLQAGILATTAFVLGAEQGLDFIQDNPGAEGVIVTEGFTFQTRGFFNYVVT